MEYAKAQSVRVVRDYVIEITFVDGTIQTIDMARELWGEMFLPLKDPEFFAQVSIDPVTGVVEWPNGADLAPEFAYAGGRIPEDAAAE